MLLLGAVLASEKDATVVPPSTVQTEAQAPTEPSFPGILVEPARPIRPPALNSRPSGCPAQDLKPLELLV